MIDIDNWMRELEEEEDIEIKNNEEYQTKLFEEYVLRGSDHQEERRKLNERYLSGEELMGEHLSVTPDREVNGLMDVLYLSLIHI